ncbi:MAG: DUF4469 domain-containing protein [Candidatus Electrothrix aestuarii]|uniref:DUF4469 domain-containing protein n=1 Tax=Candidatus Electrothrix aestuarii TaxID=3062594 RepID=A0AAU8LZA1_9BACT|nr:DUF4469 domain-containing protein [Candidatus Electrothrix aestuarii]
MPVSYYVRENKITTPPSYYCQTTAEETLGDDRVAELIHLMNPSITAAQVRTVLQNFQLVVTEQVADGKFVKLKNFVSFMPRIQARLDLPTDDIPSDAVKVAAKIPKELNRAVQNIATYERLGYPSKAPKVVVGYETKTEYPRFIREGYPFRLTGKNIGFDGTDEDLGIFLLDANENEIEQDKIGLNDPSNVIITADFGGEPAGSPNVEKTLLCRNRYTRNGTLREGSYEYVRSMNFISSEQVEMFVAGAEATGPVQAVQHDAEAEECRVEAILKPDNTMTLAIGPYIGEMGTAVILPTGGGEITLQGVTSGVDVILTVADTNAYQALYDFLLTRGRYVLEVCTMDQFGGA